MTEKQRRKQEANDIKDGLEDWEGSFEDDDEAAPDYCPVCGDPIYDGSGDCLPCGEAALAEQ